MGIAKPAAVFVGTFENSVNIRIYYNVYIKAKKALLGPLGGVPGVGRPPWLLSLLL